MVKRQTMIYKTLHSKLQIEHHEPTINWGEHKSVIYFVFYNESVSSVVTGVNFTSNTGNCVNPYIAYFNFIVCLSYQ